MFQQDPQAVGDSLALSALCALIPLLVLFVLLGGLKVRAWIAGLAALLTALVVAVALFSMPAGQAVSAAIDGGLFGFFPILWIVINAVWIYNILNPEPARELGDRKAAYIVATGAQLLVTANPGCLMQVTSAIERSGHPMGMAHTIEVLDASIRGLPAESLTTTTNTV